MLHNITHIVASISYYKLIACTNTLSIAILSYCYALLGVVGLGAAEIAPPYGHSVVLTFAHMWAPPCPMLSTKKAPQTSSQKRLCSHISGLTIPGFKSAKNFVVDPSCVESASNLSAEHKYWNALLTWWTRKNVSSLPLPKIKSLSDCSKHICYLERMMKIPGRHPSLNYNALFSE